MTIDKAIEILQGMANCVELVTHGEDFDALKLGVEALKRFQEGRPKCFISAVLLLPGETKE